MIETVRGTRDILDTHLFYFTLETIKKHLELHHYEQIELPVIESLDLFKRSLGVDTDVVGKEMFTIASSTQETHEGLCLRPEATASIVRAFVNHGDLTTPWKVFLSGPMFRYERPQKGRYRQFYQTSIECIGSASMAQDAQLITLIDRLFSQTFKLTRYVLHLNFLGLPDERTAFRDALALFLQKQETRICSTCTRRVTTNILRIFDCKEASCQTVYQDAPQLADFFQESSRVEWQQLQWFLQELSVSFIINPRLVRGLDYYNKTVFEFVSPDLGAQSTFCGGGRYDCLVKQLGGRQDQPSVGAAIGIDRLMLLLETMPDLPLPFKPMLTVILPLSPEQQGIALQLADTLTNAGITTEILFDGSIKSLFKKADQRGAHTCVVIGQEEQATGTVMIKQMLTGTEERIKQADVVRFLKR